MSSVAAIVELRSAAQKLATEELVGLSDGEAAGLLAELHEVEATLRASVVTATREVEGRQLHLRAGYRSMGGYLKGELRLHPGKAAGAAALAHKAPLLAESMAALAAGEISEAHAQVLSRAYTRRVADVFARDEALLVEKAKTMSYDQFCQVVRHWINIADPDRGKADADRAVRERQLHCSRVGDRVHTKAVSDAISGTIVKAGIERVEQELFAQDWAWTQAEYGDQATPAKMPRSPAQRRHDALILFVERGTAAKADAKLPQPLVNVICDWDTFQQALSELAGGPEADHDFEGTCELEDGTPITSQQATELALLGCVARVVFGADDVILNAGRRQRFFTPRMKAIIAVRDRCCTWPGCDLPPSRCEVDHIIEWRKGGHTDVNDGRWACPYHHRLYRKPFH